MPIVHAVAEVCGKKYDYASEDGRRLRRITDHIRACALAVHENVYPGPQKEKYVIRRLLRRAVLDGHQMGIREPFLYQLVPAVAASMSATYPELSETTERVAAAIKGEEANFFGTIDAGLAHIDRIFDDMQSAGRLSVDGAAAAELYQTYGVPAEMFETMAAENNLAFDWEGYRLAMEQHGTVSGKVSHTVMGDHGPIDAVKKVLHEVAFVGYETTEAEAQLKFIVAQEQLCEHLKEVGHETPIRVILDRTPFYGEGGGQVGDTGEIVGEQFRFQVIDTQKDGELLVHFGHLTEGEMSAGAKVTARVDSRRRAGIRRAHSATHLMHHALQANLGGHAQQQGSKVDDDWLRFDFTNPAAVTADQLQEIEQDVKARTTQSADVTAQTLPLAEARTQGAMMLFGEKYPDPVRMISMGDFSKELCGGTHLNNTAEVEDFEIIAEESVSAGTRRIVALTGARARQHLLDANRSIQHIVATLGIQPAQTLAAVSILARRVRDLKKQIASGDAAVTELDFASAAAVQQPVKLLLQNAAMALKVAPGDVADRVDSLLAEVEQLKIRIRELGSAEAVSTASLLDAAEEFPAAKLIVAETPGANPNRMRSLIDQLRRDAGPVAVLLVGKVGGDKVVLVAGISDELQQHGMHAGNWVGDVAKVVGGGGGGKATMAQAGGRMPEKIDDALQEARRLAREALAP